MLPGKSSRPGCEPLSLCQGRTDRSRSGFPWPEAEPTSASHDHRLKPFGIVNHGKERLLATPANSTPEMRWHKIRAVSDHPRKGGTVAHASAQYQLDGRSL